MRRFGRRITISSAPVRHTIQYCMKGTHADHLEERVWQTLRTSITAPLRVKDILCDVTRLLDVIR